MTEPPRSAHTRRPAAEYIIAALVGIFLLVILLQLAVSRCDSSRDTKGTAAPGAPGAVRSSPAAPVGSSPASRSPSPSARPDGPVGPTGAAGASAGPSGARTVPPNGTATAIPVPVPSGTGSAQPATVPTPSGAPSTGGGGGPGMRSPFLVVAGILLLFAGAALVLSRLWPSTLDPDDNGLA